MTGEGHIVGSSGLSSGKHEHTAEHAKTADADRLSIFLNFTISYNILIPNGFESDSYIYFASLWSQDTHLVTGRAVHGESDLQRALVRAEDFEVEIASEGAYMFEFHAVPAGRETYIHSEGTKTCRTDAEETFGNYAAVKTALGGKMALGTLRPGFDRIRHMVPEETVRGEAVEDFESLVSAAAVENAPESVKGSPVPEYIASLLGEAAVYRHEFRSGEGGGCA